MEAKDMNGKKPMFSIITVCYNAEETVGRTLQSVAAQTCNDYEHIIVDGASRDATEQTVKELSTKCTKWHSSPDQGIYDAMNKGIGLAKGKYLIFLNAGDKFHSPDTLELIRKAIVSNKQPGIVYGQTEIVDNNGKYLGPRHLKAPEMLTLDSFRDGMTVCHQAFVALKNIVPLYDLRWKFSADYEWCIRCLQHSRQNVYIPAVLIDYLNEGATTRNRWKSLRERFIIMSRYYGTLPTVVNHLGFAVRALKRKKLKSK